VLLVQIGNCSGLMQLMARYLHTLLFRCPHCGEPVEVARKSDEAAREHLDAQPFSLDCLSCRKLFGANGRRAESHSVTELRD
jgi:hypothetical protein